MKQEGDVDPARNRAWVECLMRSPLKEFVAKVPSVAWAMCGHAIHAYYSSICHLNVGVAASEHGSTRKGTHISGGIPVEPFMDKNMAPRVSQAG
jgi:hypothetical protein